MKTKILVLGSNGFVGREVVKLLSKKNILLSCFSRSKKKNINLEKKKIKDLVINNDVIINCVGENFRKKYMYKNNFLFVKELIKIINSSKKKKKN